MKNTVLQIAVPVPFRKLYDYLPLDNQNPKHLKPGIRIKIPFGKTEKVGVLIKVSGHSEYPLNKLKPVCEYLDETPVFDAEHLAWLVWISQYYHHPIGDTLLTALPVYLRKPKPATLPTRICWRISTKGQATDADTLKRAKKQQAIFLWLKQQPDWIDAIKINKHFTAWRTSIKGLVDKELVDVSEQKIKPDKIPTKSTKSKTLNKEQQIAVNKVVKQLNQFAVSVVYGVTGSGKTEVYLNIIEQVITKQEQALVLIPEIGLTPQLLQRFSNRFGSQVAVMHSGMNDTERYQIWQNTRTGVNKILIGTRSAIFTPFAKLGIIIIDEEHDLSFKQQDGLRYSARDIAISRAKSLTIPVVLGSATPSLESLANAKKGMFRQLLLKQRAGNARPPLIHTIDLKGKELQENLSPDLIRLMNQTLERQEQVILFLNRRGFAPTMLCHECGWSAMCQRCDTHMTIHRGRQRIVCHHCGTERKIPMQCPECSSLDLRPIGFGTERVEQVLQQLFPDTEIIRIDRDTTSGKNAIHNLLNKVSSERGQILLGTQMLAKGHDFPNVTLVGILDADQGLFGIDLRASERMAQLITQVAGRAGRGDKAGKVIIQTHHPDHPLLKVMIDHGYQVFAESALSERKAAGLPPYAYAALIRSESTHAGNNIQFLNEVKNLLAANSHPALEVLGPAPSPMERKAGKYRTQLLLNSVARPLLHNTLNKILPEIEQLKSGKRVRWSIDIDPLDMS